MSANKESFAGLKAASLERTASKDAAPETVAPEPRPSSKREVPQHLKELERYLAFRIGQSGFHRFETRRLQAAAHFPQLSKEEALLALVGMVDEDAFFEAWLDRIEQERAAR